MFSLREFVRQAMLKAVGKQEDYKIMQNSLGWYEKDVLTQEDLAEIQEAIERSHIIPEETHIEEESVTEDNDSEPTPEVINDYEV